jgi:caspase-like apoptosis-related cysteine protease
MSHGDDGILYAKDQQYKPEKLWSHFTSDQCPTLAGKPKLFFIQVNISSTVDSNNFFNHYCLFKACQGDRLDAGTTMLPRITETDSPSAVAYKIPTHADFLIAYSTVPGKITFNTYRLPMTLFAILFVPLLFRFLFLAQYD